MFITVKSIALATGISLFALSSAAFADETIAFSEIDVELSISAAQDANAMTVYPQITADLQAAISDRVMGSDDASKPTIRVDIRKISLNGNTMLDNTKTFNEIEGVVSISDENGSIGAQSFPVNVIATAPTQAVPEGYIAVPPSDADFYVVMINSFADVVAENVANLNTSGEGRDK